MHWENPTSKSHFWTNFRCERVERWFISPMTMFRATVDSSTETGARRQSSIKQLNAQMWLKKLGLSKHDVVSTRRIVSLSLSLLGGRRHFPSLRLSKSRRCRQLTQRRHQDSCRQRLAKWGSAEKTSSKARILKGVWGGCCVHQLVVRGIGKSMGGARLFAGRAHPGCNS